MTKRRILFSILAAICAGILAEIFIFNFGHWESVLLSRGGTEASADAPQSAGIRLSGMADIEAGGDGAVIRSLCLSAGFGTEDRKASVIPVHIIYTDASNGITYSLPDHVFIPSIPETGYIRIHTDRKIRSMQVQLDLPEGVVPEGGEIRINQARPLCFHYGRAAVIMGALFLLFLLLPGSVLYRERLDFGQRSQRILTAVMLAAQIILIIACGMSTRPDLNWAERNRHHRQYEELSTAMRHGRIDLEEIPPQSLQEMENPYDYMARAMQGNVSGDDYLSDTSYYRGHYYVYFGVVPELLFFLPCLVLTGHVLPTWAAVIACACLYAAGIFFLLRQLCRRYAPSVSIGIYLVLCWAVMAATQTLYIAHYASAYTMPLITGMLCGAWGISFWLMARGSDPLKKINRIYLTAGSILTALVIGCRPQMAILAILAFPLFYTEIIRGDFFRLTKKSIANTMCVLGPWLVLGGCFLWYNALRFDDPLEFGVRYLLTVTDMTQMTPKIAAIPAGIMFHLLQPMRIAPEFPFVRAVDTAVSYMGDLYIEPLSGGFFACNLIAITGVALPWLNSAMAGKSAPQSSGDILTAAADQQYPIPCGREAWLLGMTALFSAFLLTVLDILMAGISQRYQADYAWLFMLASVMAILYADGRISRNTDEDVDADTDHYRASLRKIFHGSVLFLTALCVSANILIVLSNDLYFSVKALNPSGYYRLCSLFFSFGG